MKRLITITILSLFLTTYTASAQEHHGKTLNLGLGVGGYSGYSKYAAHSLPVFNINYYYWSNAYYTYRETVIPVGVKGTYYFDELLKAHAKWDFYAAGSVGFAVVNSRWQAGFDGDKNHFHRGNSLFADLHVGAEYHFSRGAGVFLDLSSGISTIGLAIH
jgi:hypothetical protein